jgi:hypothetical protein
MGAVVVRKALVAQSGAVFLPSAVFTKHLMARDLHFVLECVSTLGGRGVSLVHRVLMLQQ